MAFSTESSPVICETYDMRVGSFWRAYPVLGGNLEIVDESQHCAGVTAEYPATLTALLRNHGYSVRSVWGNNLKCSKAVLGAGYAVRGTR